MVLMTQCHISLVNEFSASHVVCQAQYAIKFISNLLFTSTTGPIFVYIRRNEKQRLLVIDF